MQSDLQEGTLNLHKTVPATVTIQFTDGTTQCFGFEAQDIDPITSASAPRLENLLVRKQIQIHLPDRVLVIPMRSIKCMEFTLVPRLPSNLSGFVIRNARPISASQAMDWYELEPPPEHDRPTRILENGNGHKRPIASVEK